MISLKIDIDPVAKERPRVNQITKSIYTPAKTRLFEKTIRQIALIQYKGDPIDYPVKMELDFYISRPKSVKREYPSVRPDLDNYVKAVLDGLQPTVLLDDSFIVDLHTRKLYTSGSGYIKLVIAKLNP
jgi:Holliday junction resolvase RusA-like endonuclease